MATSAANVIVNHLQIRGLEADVAAARRNLPDTLNRCHWPSTADDEIIFIRHLHIRQRLTRVATDTVAQTVRLSRLAIDADAPGASQAAAIRFRNQAHFHACLIHDLLLPSAPRKWYWQSRDELFALPADSAACALLCDSPLLIPGIYALLPGPARRVLWQSLKAEQVSGLLHAIARATGWTGLLQPDPSSSQPAVGKRETDRLVIYPEDMAAIGNDQTAPLKKRLAAVIILWQQAPHLLQQRTAPMAIAQVIQQSNAIFTPDAVHKISDIRDMVTSDSDEQNLPIQAKRRATTPAAAMPAAGDKTGVPKEPVSTPHLAGGAEEPLEISIDEGVESDERYLSDQGIVTAWGGLFYLLNVLNLPMAQRIWRQPEPFSGWLWLYHLARQIGCEPDPALLRFMGLQFDPTDPQAITHTSAPDSLLLVARFAKTRYGESLWQANTFSRPARLIADHSHITLHFPMEAVDLEIRRHGLDINPGWLPWLGRVVQFHYGSGREPGGER